MMIFFFLSNNVLKGSRGHSCGLSLGDNRLLNICLHSKLSLATCPVSQIQSKNKFLFVKKRSVHPFSRDLS